MSFKTTSEISKANKAELLDYLSDQNIRNAHALKRDELVTLAKNKLMNNTTKIPLPAINGDLLKTSKGNISVTPQWLLDQLEENETENGKPKCDGLRRIFLEHIGNILETNVQVVQCATSENEGRSTVIVSIKYLRYDDNQIYVRSDASDCSYRNSNRPFSNHPTATAVTMAEGRCLRKIMGLNILTQEELLEQDTESMDTTFISKSQEKILLSACSKMHIDPRKFLIKLDLIKESDSISNLCSLLTYTDAQLALRELMKYKRDIDHPEFMKIPQEILLA